MLKEELLKELEALGIDPSRVGDGAILGESTEDVAEGRAVAPPSESADLELEKLVASEFADVTLVEENNAVVEQFGVRAYKVEEDPSLWSFTFPEGTRPQARSRGTASEGAIVPDPADLDTVHINTRDGRVTAIELPDGRGMIVIPEKRGTVETKPLLRHVIQLPGLTQIDPVPFPGWIEAVEEVDGWLAGQLQIRIASEDPWEIVVAGGMLARLFDPGYAIPFHEMSATDDGLALGKNGDIWEAVVAVRKWAKKELSEADHRTVADLGRAEVDRLLAFLDSIERSFRRESFSRIEDDLLALCLGRDDFEGVRVLMAESDVGHSLSKGITLLDEIALDFFNKPKALELKAKVLADDERLRRVGIADPVAWWGHSPR